MIPLKTRRFFGRVSTPQDLLIRLFNHLSQLCLTSLKKGVMWSCIVCLLTSCLQEGDGIAGLFNQGSESTFLARVMYPEGPYGVTRGEVIQNLDFQRSDGAPIDLEELYKDYNNQLLLITTSAEWCTACIKEQPKLEELYQRYRSRGLQIMVSLFQDNAFEPATPEHASRWQEKYQLSFLVVADEENPSSFAPYYDINLTPMVMLVDAQKMEIIYINQGFDEDQVEALIEARLPDSLPRSMYPEGPYGVSEGELIEDLPFTQITGEEFHLSDIYSDPSKRLLLLSTSAEWCTACIKEQPKLEELYQQYSAQGLEVMVSMFQDSNFEPAVPDIARKWRDKYKLSFIVVSDQEDPSVLSRYYDVNLTPMVMLVELDSMKITYISQGFDEDHVKALISARLGE